VRQPASRAWLWLGAKAAVSIALLVYLLLRVDWPQTVRVVRQANTVMIGVAPLFYLGALWLGAARWRLVLADSGIHYSGGQAYRAYLVGQLYNILLPGAIGGDLVRIGMCAKSTACSVPEATASVLLERASGMIALLAFLVCVTLLPSFGNALSGSELAIPLIRGVALGTGAALILLVAGRRALAGWVLRRPTTRVWRPIQLAVRLLSNVRWTTLAAVLFLAALFQMCDIAASYVLSRAIGLELPFATFFLVMPIVYLATALPISLGGLGVREGTLTLLLSQFGVDPSDAILLAFLFYLSRVCIAALGGLVQLFGGPSSGGRPWVRS